MDIETLREYVLQKPNVTEGFPFGDTVVVFKVNDKMFLLVPLDTEQLQFNAKCDPDHAIELREQYDCIQPGFHMNKKHWNTVIVDGTIKNNQLLELVDESYHLVASKSKKKK